VLDPLAGVRRSGRVADLDHRFTAVDGLVAELAIGG
jgi:hypothetical protein